MPKILNKIRFEYILIFALVCVLTGVVFYPAELSQTSNTALIAITNLLSGVSGFLWGITQTNPTK